MSWVWIVVGIAAFLARWYLLNIVLLVFNKMLGTQLACGPLGSRSNPVKCFMPSGEVAYLERLRGQRGERVLFQRLGSLSLPSPYGNIVDLYAIGFDHTGPVAKVFMDMYFPEYEETRPIRGFTIVADRDERERTSQQCQGAS